MVCVLGNEVSLAKWGMRRVNGVTVSRRDSFIYPEKAYSAPNANPAISDGRDFVRV